jgi:AraC-like DNA-binding protein
LAADLVPMPSGLLERLAALGVDVPRVLRDAHISHDLTPRARVTTREFFAFWHAVERWGGGRELGLRLGTEARMHQLDVASHAACHAPTFGDALKTFARYKRLICPEEVSVDTAGDEAHLRFHWILADEHPPLILVDATFASVVALGRRGTGTPISPRRIELTRRCADEAVLTRHFGCEIRFDAPIDLLVFERSVLTAPFLTYNEDLLAFLLPGLEAALNEPGMPRTLIDDVRTTLSRHLHGERPTIGAIAKELGMSARTLQRRLAEVGTTYQEALDGVRRQVACRLLANTDLDAGAVAFLLGFEELNSFTRAFSAWEGTTPSRWRASNNHQSASLTAS